MLKPKNPYHPKPVGEEREYGEMSYGMRYTHGQFMNSMPTCDYRETGTFLDVKPPSKGGKRGSR